MPVESHDETRTVHDPILDKDVQVSDRLTDRLRGRYACGPVMPNGEPEFGWREFETPPIQHEAATRIESDAKRIAELEAHCQRLGQGGAERYWEGRYRDEAVRVETAERALAEERERHQWRTIESAPKDGTLIDLWMMSEHRRLANCRWSTADEPSHKGAWFCQQGGRSFNMGADDAFTHWRPHPAPPDATAIRSGKTDGKE